MQSYSVVLVFMTVIEVIANPTKKKSLILLNVEQIT